MIDRRRYPQLDRLLWDIHEQEIEERQAFRAYEQRWAFVEPGNLGASELALLDQLTRTVGNGVFLPMNMA